MDKIKRQARKIIEIRTFEETILRLFSENKLSGTTHTCIGEEATAVGLMEHIAEEDKIFSNHRCHGHYLAYGGPKEALLAEIMSKESGLCQGRGGSQHIHYKNFFSNGVQGGIVPNALGVAWADKLKKQTGVTVVFIGDGTLGQGLVYESFNMAALYGCPVLFVIEDNSYAMSTKRENAVSGSILKRPEAFGIETAEITSNDVEELDACFEKAFAYVREQRKPFCQIVHNYRLAAHSKGDDFRDTEEIAAWKKKDPVVLLEEKLGREYCDACREQANAEMAQIIDTLEKQNIISIDEYTKQYYEEMQQRIARKATGHENDTFFALQADKVLNGIHDAIETLMKNRQDIILMGEDICDPYGGAFRVTKGLSTQFPDRVINTPISEAAMAGASVGLAMNHMIPIVEIMFGDFVSLCFDQILNHAGKYAWVYGDGVKVPAIFRIPSGGGRGYGPTHSQSLEKYLLGIPMINMVALTTVLDVKKLYLHAVECTEHPLIVIENKKMYGERMKPYQDGRIGDFAATISHLDFSPAVKLSLDEDCRPDVTLITYGGMVQTALDAAEELMLKEEIQMDVIVLTQLAPFPMNDLRALLDCDCIGTLEEGNETGGVGSEIISRLAQAAIGKKYFKIASRDIPIPNGVALEKQMVPATADVVSFVKSYL